MEKGLLPLCCQFKICGLSPWWSQRELGNVHLLLPLSLIVQTRGSGQGSLQGLEFWLPCATPQGQEGTQSRRTQTLRGLRGF